MTDHEKRASERVPVALRIRLRYHAVDQFISKFAVNISRGGMFLSSRNPKPPGTEIYFEIRLADESPVIEGSGEVRWIREYDRRHPDEPHGMGIEFIELAEESWPVLERIIAHRRGLGEKDDDAIPDPGPATRSRAARARADTAALEAVTAIEPVMEPAIEAAGMFEAAVHVDAAVPIEAAVLVEPAALLEPDEPEPAATGEAGASVMDEAPAMVEDAEPFDDAPAEAGGTRGDGAERGDAAAGRVAARRDNGLGDPNERLRRELLHALAPTVLLPVGPGERAAAEPVVRAAIARARALTGGVHGAGDLDRQLDALLEESAVPVEITIEAASRELAQRLGGAAVERRTGPARAPADPPARRSPAGAARPDEEPDEEPDGSIDEPDAPGRAPPVRRAPKVESSPAGEPHAARLSRSES